MVAQLKVWHAEYVCGERGGRSGGADDASRQAYAEHRLWIEAAVLEIIVPTHLDRPLEVIRQDIMERVAAISDALATDISCAQYAPLRRWQNTVLIPLQAEFMALKEQPDLERYKHALRQFLQTDEGGAAILNIELEQLRQYTEYPEGVAEFVEAITEPVPD